MTATAVFQVCFYFEAFNVFLMALNAFLLHVKTRKRKSGLVVIKLGGENIFDLERLVGMTQKAISQLRVGKAMGVRSTNSGVLL